MDNNEKLLKTSLLNSKLVEAAQAAADAGCEQIKQLLENEDYDTLYRRYATKVLDHMDVTELFKLIHERVTLLKEIMPNLEGVNPVNPYDVVEPPKESGVLIETLHGVYHDLGLCGRYLVFKLFDIDLKNKPTDAVIKEMVFYEMFGFRAIEDRRKPKQELQIPQMPSHTSGPSRESYFIK